MKPHHTATAKAAIPHKSNYTVLVCAEPLYARNPSSTRRKEIYETSVSLALLLLMKRRRYPSHLSFYLPTARHVNRTKQSKTKIPKHGITTTTITTAFNP